MRVSGSLAGQRGGPVAVERVEGDDVEDENKRVRKRVYLAAVGEQARQMLAGVVNGGTGKAASIGEFAAGKTGTTENYGDAWFVGFNDELTVAVWVGYADKLKQMKTEYSGGPVAGGTYPAEIWHDFMTDWIRIRDERKPGAQGAPAHHGADHPHPGPGRPARRRRPPRRRPRPRPSPRRPSSRLSSRLRRPRSRRRPSRRRPPRPPAAAGTAAARRPAKQPRAAAHRRRPGPRHVAAVGVAEAPGQLGRLGDADPRALGQRGAPRCAARSRSVRR